MDLQPDERRALPRVPEQGGEKPVSVTALGSVELAAQIVEGLQNGTLRCEPVFVNDPARRTWRMVSVSIVRNE